jgi:branched-chain amino acid transport system substrate-binding protein
VARGRRSPESGAPAAAWAAILLLLLLVWPAALRAAPPAGAAAEASTTGSSTTPGIAPTSPPASAPSAPSGEPIHLAGIFALTGVATSANAGATNGLRAAINEINKRGGVLGRPLVLELFDNQSTPIGSMVAARKAVAAGVAAILGPSWSSHALAVARVAQDAKVPMLATIATNPNVTEVGDHIFRACFTDRFQGRVMADFARRELHAATALLFTDVASDFSIGLSGEFRSAFAGHGGKVLGELDYKTRRTDFTPLAAQARASDADVCFLSGHDEAGLIVTDLAQAKASCLPLGGDGWDVPIFFQKGGNRLKRGYYCTHWSKEATDQITRELVRRYASQGPLDASFALSYDAAYLIADALRRAGTEEHAALRDALATTRDFTGVTGRISFNQNGDPIKSAVIMEIRNGEERFYKRIDPVR